MSEPVLILFAKTPIPGKVKTRLQPQLCPELASKVACLFVEHTVHLAQENWPGKIALHVWPTTNHPLFSGVSADLGVSLKQQCDGDLGQKMYNALAGYRGTPAAIMGCDVPHCPGGILRQAFSSLNQGRNVIGPTHDGGYYLIGMQAPMSALFQNIEWGTGNVFTKTKQRAGQYSTDFEVLPTLVDIDNFDDLMRITPRFSALREIIRISTHGIQKSK